MFTKLSVGSFQPNGIPVFDETQTNYVKEEMSLYRFTSSRVKIRFQLRTDESVARDGWYVDDRGIIFYSEIPVELSSSRAKTGSNGVILNWITTTELNK